MRKVLIAVAAGLLLFSTGCGKSPDVTIDVQCPTKPSPRYTPAGDER